MTSDGGNHWDEDEPQIELRGDPAYRQGGMAYTAGGYDEESPGQAPRSRRFGPLRFALVGVALLVLAGLIVYAYSWGTADPSPDELPLIAAPSGAEKEPP